MALRTADSVIVETTAYQYMAVQTGPKTERQDKNDPKSAFVQKTNSDGVPLWTVDVLRTEMLSGAASIVSVTIPSKKEPEVTGPVVFQNLLARQWAVGGNAGLAFSADAVSPA